MDAKYAKICGLLKRRGPEEIIKELDTLGYRVGPKITVQRPIESELLKYLKRIANAELRRRGYEAP